MMQNSGWNRLRDRNSNRHRRRFYYRLGRSSFFLAWINSKYDIAGSLLAHYKHFIGKKVFYPKLLQIKGGRRLETRRDKNTSKAVSDHRRTAAAAKSYMRRIRTAAFLANSFGLRRRISKKAGRHQRGCRHGMPQAQSAAAAKSGPFE